MQHGLRLPGADIRRSGQNHDRRHDAAERRLIPRPPPPLCLIPLIPFRDFRSGERPTTANVVRERGWCWLFYPRLKPGAKNMSPASTALGTAVSGFRRQGNAEANSAAIEMWRSGGGFPVASGCGLIPPIPWRDFRSGQRSTSASVVRERGWCRLFYPRLKPGAKNRSPLTGFSVVRCLRCAVPSTTNSCKPNIENR